MKGSIPNRPTVGSLPLRRKGGRSGNRSCAPIITVEIRRRFWRRYCRIRHHE
jgi:hypothetical protein